jgi:nucleoside-diphosphate-sugar epimerase
MSSHPQRVLITGVYGLVGNVVYRRLIDSPAVYDVFGLVRRRQPSDRLPADHLCPVPDDHLLVANLTDMPAVQRAAQGMDVIVHMAADPNGGAAWQSVLENNIIGSYNVFEAGRLAGVKRIIYASTMQVVHGYGKEEPYASLMRGDFANTPPGSFAPVSHLQPPRPLNLYASSKVFGEALAHTYAHSHGLSCICLRIGWVADPEPPNDRSIAAHWCSQRDIAQLVQRCIDAPAGLRFDIFHGLSQSVYNMADIQHARDVLGYAPQDEIKNADKR